MITLDNGCQLELIEDDAGRFLGFGEVTVAGVRLRDEKTPMVVRVDTPEGILYTELRRQETRQVEGGVDLVFAAHGLAWGRAEYRDDYEQEQIVPRDPGDIVDELTIRLRPAARTVRERDFKGFGLSLCFHSETRRVHRLLLLATWELGGTLEGVTVCSQGQCSMPVYEGGREGLFTTTCLNRIGRYGDPTEVSYQLGTRGGLVQPFDFEHGPQGVLFGWWPTQGQVVSCSESPPGDHRLHVADEWRFPLTSHYETDTRETLFLAGDIPAHEARNLWWSARELVYGSLRERFAVVPTVPRPETGLQFDTRFGGRESVQVDGRWEVRGEATEQARLEIGFCGEWVPTERVPYAIGDVLLPRLAAAGIKRFFPIVMSESDVTELGDQRKLDNGVHGDLHCASVCATHRFFPAAFWGGIEAWRYMADKAHELDIEIGAWFAPHFSPRTPYYQEHPEWRMIGPATTPNSGGYSFQTLVTADWNTPIYEAVFADLKRWKEEGGLDYVFTDSFCNLGLAQVNFRAEMRDNFAALARFYRDLQGIGIMSHSFEALSPWGISRFGIQDLRGDLEREKQAVAGQNDLAWYVGNEDMMVGITAMVHPRERGDEELIGMQFRANAGGGCISWHALGGTEHTFPQWHVDLNRIYEQARPHMQVRTVMADGAGIEWHDEAGKRVRWCYRDQDAPATNVQHLTPDGPTALDGTTLRGGQVYIYTD